MILRLAWPAGSQVKDATRYWQLTQGNANGLERGAERVHRKDKSWVSHLGGQSPRGVEYWNRQIFEGCFPVQIIRPIFVSSWEG